MTTATRYNLNVKQTGSGAAVVLLHGLVGSNNYWNRVTNTLSRTGYSTYAVDLLGFGESPKPSDASYSTDDHVDAVYAALSKYKQRSFILVGHSMGSLVAVRFAARYPKLVKKLVLCNIPLFSEGQDITKIISLSNIAPRIMINGKTAEIICKTAHHIPLIQTLLRLYPHKLPQDIKADFLKHTWNSYSESLRYVIEEYDPLPDLRRLTMPINALMGGKDKITNPFMARAKLPENVTIQVLHDADHHLPVFYASVVAEAIKQ